MQVDANLPWAVQISEDASVCVCVGATANCMLFVQPHKQHEVKIHLAF